MSDDVARFTDVHDGTVQTTRRVTFTSLSMLAMPEMLERAAAWLREHDEQAWDISCASDDMGAYLTLYLGRGCRR